MRLTGTATFRLAKLKGVQVKTERKGQKGGEISPPNRQPAKVNDARSVTCAS
jgi:hypothetical protein